MPDYKAEAVKRRESQGRSGLDTWDMLANVMTSRWAAPTGDPSHLDLKGVCEKLVEEVHNATDLPKPNAVAIEDSSGHASTNGGWYNRGREVTNKPEIKLTFKKNYVEKALNQVKDRENTDLFRKLMRTTSHEMTHVAQRGSKQVMEDTDSDQREAEAYGSELTKHEKLPALWGDEFNKTVSKFNKRYNKIDTPTKTEIALRKKVDELSDHGVGI